MAWHTEFEEPLDRQLIAAVVREAVQQVELRLGHESPKK
jgi:hypothetical protein